MSVQLQALWLIYVRHELLGLRVGSEHLQSAATRYNLLQRPLPGSVRLDQ